jgi:hypothetical protein
LVSEAQRAAHVRQATFLQEIVKPSAYVNISWTIAGMETRL